MKPLIAAIVLCSPLVAAEHTIDQAALAYLEGVRDKWSNWKENSALFDGTTKEKKAIITKQWRQLSDSLGDDPLSVVEQRADGDLGAVIISQVHEIDPNRVRIHALGMLHRDGQWCAAPVPGSFENTGLRYVPGKSETAEQLEAWMSQHTSAHLAGLRHKSQSELRARIRAAVDPDKLAQMSPEALVEEFITACRSGHVTVALAHLGGLKNQPPKQWERAVSGMAAWIEETPHDDDPLLAKDSLWVGIEKDSSEFRAQVQVGVYNPAKPDDWKVERFHLTREEGEPWHLKLPTWITDEEEDEGDGGNLLPGNSFLQRLLKSLERPSFDTPEALASTFIESFTRSNFRELLAFYQNPGHRDDDEAEELLHDLSRFWRKQTRTASQPTLIEAVHAEHVGWATYADFDSFYQNPNPKSLRHLKLIRSEQGWQVATEFDLRIDEDLPESLKAWKDGIAQRKPSDWHQQLGLQSLLDEIPEGPSPAEAEAREAALEWAEQIRVRNPKSALMIASALNDETGIRRCYEFVARELELDEDSQLKLMTIHRHGRWAGASIRHAASGKNTQAYDLLHPIIQTEDGPRIFPEAILYYETTRSHRFLNETALKRLKRRLPEDAFAELESLLDMHQVYCQSTAE